MIRKLVFFVCILPMTPSFSAEIVILQNEVYAKEMGLGNLCKDVKKELLAKSNFCEAIKFNGKNFSEPKWEANNSAASYAILDYDNDGTVETLQRQKRKEFAECPQYDLPSEYIYSYIGEPNKPSKTTGVRGFRGHYAPFIYRATTLSYLSSGPVESRTIQFFYVRKSNFGLIYLPICSIKVNASI